MRKADFPALAEFNQDIDEFPPTCRGLGLTLNKLNLEKDMEVVSAEGKVRMLKQPWSVLAYQIAGNADLKILHSESRAEERESAPAENHLIELLEIPYKENLGTLILIDEVLMYARERVGREAARLNSLITFFQYLTQAAPKVGRCCIAASLLTSEPTAEDGLGRKIKGHLYEIFQRECEESVEPVLKEDVAEVLRRRFFTPQSLKDREEFRQHVVFAIKGITAVDEQTARQGAQAEDRFLKSFPFHPDLTEVLYSKWTQLARFRRTCGILRTFALTLPEVGNWDRNPLVGPAVFLSSPDKESLSEVLRELVTVADTPQVPLMRSGRLPHQNKWAVYYSSLTGSSFSTFR